MHKHRHTGDCTIYASLCNIGTPEAGICTCGYGAHIRFKEASEREMYSKEFEEANLAEYYKEKSEAAQSVMDHDKELIIASAEKLADAAANLLDNIHRGNAEAINECPLMTKLNEELREYMKTPQERALAELITMMEKK